MADGLNNEQFGNPEKVQMGLAFCVLGRAESAALAKGAGFDVLLVDMEHGPIGLDALGQVAVAGRGLGIEVWGRVTGPHSPDLGRVLDCGATGLIAPHVDSAEQARAMVTACRFAPVGARALPGPLPALDYRILNAHGLCAEAGAGITLAAMIESAAGLAASEAIAAVEGIDMLVIGTNDLADGLGYRGQPEHPVVAAAFKRIAGAAAQHGKRFGVMGLPENLLADYAYALGASLIVVTNETNLIVLGGAAALERARAAAPQS